MKGFRIFWGTVFVILFVMYFAYYSRLVPFLILTTLIICAVSLAGAIMTRLCISIKVIPPKHTHVYRKEEVTFTIRIKNNFILPLTPIWIHVTCLKKGVYLPQTKLFVAAVPPFKEMILDVKSVTSFRGEYEIGFQKAEFYDVLKIHRFCVKAKTMCTITSYHRELEKYNYLCNENLVESEAPQTKPNELDFKKDVFSHLREYRVGESLRHIHWKLSSRIPDGDLIIRHMEATRDYSALVFCDVEPSLRQSDEIEETLETSDTVIEAAQAVIRDILKNRDCAICIHKKEKVSVSNINEYSNLAKTFALLPPQENENETVKLSELLDATRDEIRLERAIFIVTAAVNNELVLKLQEVGLINKSNVVLIVIPSAANQRHLMEYLKTKTKVTVYYEDE